jgi:LPXTG-motif cell wall-anchored protein
MNLTETTTNTATAKGSANGMTATDVAVATVIVTPTAVVTPTITGGQLPNTSTPLYELLLIGAALVVLGAIGWKSRKHYD